LLVHDGQKFKLGVVVNGEHNHPAKHEAVRDVLNILKEQACMENPLPVREAVKLARESVPIDLRKAGECSTATMGRCYRNYLKVSFSVFDGFFWVERFGRFFETFLFYLS